MRLTVDRLELYRAAGPLGAAIDPPAHPDSPAGLVTLVAAGRILSLIRADADVSATAVVRADVAAPGAVTVRASVLNANARHTPSGPLAIEAEAGWVAFASAAGRVRTEAVDHRFAPTGIEGPATPWERIQDMEVTARRVGTGVGRPADDLDLVGFAPGPVLVSSSGRRLVVVGRPNGSRRPVTVAPARVVRAAGRAGGPFDIAAGPDFLSLAGEWLTVTARTARATLLHEFRRVARLAGDRWTCQVEGRPFAAAVRAVVAADGGSLADRPVVLRVRGRRLTLTSFDPDLGDTGSEIRAVSGSPDARLHAVAYAGHLVDFALTGGRLVRLSWDDGHTILLSSDGDYQCLTQTIETR